MRSQLQNANPESRQEEITGKPPRLLPLPRSEISADGLEIVRRLRTAAKLPETTEIPEVASTMLRHPSLYEKHASLGTELLGHGSLTARHREIAILRTAWLCRAPFEWGAHVAMSKRVGINSEEIDRLTSSSSAAEWDEQEHAIVRTAEQLHDDAMISDDVWKTLTSFLDDRQIIELIYVVGHYTKVAFLQNALRLRLPEGNRGLMAR